MYRYVAIYSTTKNTSRTLSAKKNLISEIQTAFPNSETLVHESELSIIHWPSADSPMKAHRMAGSRGAVMGYLFTPNPDGTELIMPQTAPETLPDPESQKIVDTRGGLLRDKYWGAYVAFIRDPDTLNLTVFRSPFGCLPCFYLQLDGITLFFSDLSLLRILRKYGVELDWTFVPIYFQRTYVQSDQTAFRQINKLLAAQSIEFNSDQRKISYLWNPVGLTRDSYERDYSINDAISTIHNVVYSCFYAWATVFPKAVLLLSGGFDSSLVAGIMASLPNKPELLCTTYYDPSVDERDYARLTARRAGYKIIERKLDPLSNNTSFYYQSPLSLNPYNITTNKDNEWLDTQIAKEFGAVARLGGEGGDLLFAAASCGNTAYDYVFDHGICRGLFKAALNSAYVTDKSVWHTFAESVKYRIWGERSLQNRQISFDLSWGTNPEICSVLTDIVMDAPWEKASDIPPIKRDTIGPLMYPTDKYERLRGLPTLDGIDPLLSQPVVEACIKIPTYVHQYNGKERGLARSAFRAYLVDEVRLRQFKRNGAPFFSEMVARNRHFYLDFLMDGLLAKRDLLDKKAIERVLHDPSVAEPEHYHMISQMANVEAWSRTWQNFIES